MDKKKFTLMKKSNSLNPATIAARANGAIDKANGGVVPPIHTSTTFVRDRDYELNDIDTAYARDSSDVTRIAENILNKLEGASQTLIFPSGMAAIASLMRTLARGEKLLIQSGIYWGTTSWIRNFCQRREVQLREVDCSNADLMEKEISEFKPDIVFIEVPSNPWLKIADISRAAKSCNNIGALLAVDSTAATPVLTRPISFGAHIVMHSATKAINGHSDVLAGVLCVSDEDLPRWQQIKIDRHGAGAVIGSFESWLLTRGMRTLPLRIERMCDNALAVAKFLQNHPKIEKVNYPGLSSHPQHELATSQLSGGFGFLMSMLIKGNREDALKVCGALNIIHRATSLGGVESLIEHRQTIEPDLPKNMLRISIGIEHVDDLIGDLDGALAVL